MMNIEHSVDVDELLTKYNQALERIAELEKNRDVEAENCNFCRIRLQRLIDGNLELKKRIAELKETIERMKCYLVCSNKKACGLET